MSGWTTRARDRYDRWRWSRVRTRLAGRLELLEMGGFSLAEVRLAAHDRHLRRGGFPRSFLARSEADSLA